MDFPVLSLIFVESLLIISIVELWIIQFSSNFQMFRGRGGNLNVRPSAGSPSSHPRRMSNSSSWETSSSEDRHGSSSQLGSGPSTTQYPRPPMPPMMIGHSFRPDNLSQFGFNQQTQHMQGSYMQGGHLQGGHADIE